MKAIVTAVHGRREVTQMFVDHYRDWDVLKICVASTDDDVQFMRDNGWHVVQHENRPLGAKWNAVIRFALEFEWEQLIQVGSDDLMNPKYLNFANHVAFGGVKTLYFWEKESGECMKYTYVGNRKDYILGAGRVMSRYVVETVWKETEGELFPNHYNKGLDSGSELHIKLSGFKPELIQLPYPMIVDVKSGENIWSFKTLKDRAKDGTSYEEVSLATVEKHITT
jgi:hypothetical protein